VVIVDIIALILAFVMTRDRKQVKIVGIVLIIIAFVNLIAPGGFGIIGFILILVAGIVALRWKPVGYEPTYTSSGAISRKLLRSSHYDIICNCTALNKLRVHQRRTTYSG
jgi:hypothetical protein